MRLERRRWLASVVAGALLAGCTTAPLAPPPLPPPAPKPATPEAWYQAAAAAGKRVWNIDSAASLISVVVRRGGSLARLGHDHVVASHDVTGWVAPDDNRADFQFRLDTLRVDEDALRQQAGLTTSPSADAIEGTRRNMLTTVLEAERHPLVSLHAETLPAPANKVRLTITLHGVTRTLEVPATIARLPDQMTVSGAFTLRQTDFAIVPMSVLGGAISVQDEMALQYRIVARAQRR